MAPATSQMRQSRRGLALSVLAVGGMGASQLFVTPGGQPRALQQSFEAGTREQVLASAGASRQFMSPAALACVGLAGVGAAASMKRTATRVRAVDSEAEPEVEVAPAFNPAVQVGALAPVGYFDPLGFCSEGDEKGFRKMRAAELKHGRVAMMASVGLVGQHFIKFPGFENAPAGFACAATGEGVFGLFGIGIMSAILELAWREEDWKEPGNFGDPFGVNMYNEEMRNKEISNGRFAMICVLAIFAAEMASGKDAIQQFGL